MKILKEIWSYVLIILIVLFIRAFIITPVSVDGDSMYPNLKDNEILLLKKYDKSFERFDIIVFNDGSSKLIKRIIGLPGEYVEYKHNKLYINDEEIDDIMLLTKTGDFRLVDLGVSVIPEDMYFVLGDNRTDSKDSRIIGLISKQDIQGTVSFRIFPFDRFGNIK